MKTRLVARRSSITSGEIMNKQCDQFLFIMMKNERRVKNEKMVSGHYCPYIYFSRH